MALNSEQVSSKDQHSVQIIWKYIVQGSQIVSCKHQNALLAPTWQTWEVAEGPVVYNPTCPQTGGTFVRKFERMLAVIFF